MTEQGWEALLKLADKLEGQARKDFLNAVAGIREQVDLEELADAIMRGQTLSVDYLVGDFEMRERLAPFLETVHNAFVEAGQLTALQIAQSITLPSLRFDLTNPKAVELARSAAGQFVTEVSAETQLAIRNTVVRSFTEGLTRREVSKMIRPLIGLTSRQAIAVLNYRESLTELNADRINALSDRYAAKLLKQRSETIARTELMTQLNAGRDAMWQQVIEHKQIDASIERKWTVTPDDRLCPYCQALKGQKRTLGSPFVSPLTGRSVLRPPLHPNCRCVLILVILKLFRRIAA